MRLNLATLLVMAVGTNAAMTSTQVVDNIKDITQSSSEVNDVAKSISLPNVAQKGPALLNGFKDIIATVSKDISAMGLKRRSVNIFPEENGDPIEPAAKRQIEEDSEARQEDGADGAEEKRSLTNKRQDEDVGGVDAEGVAMRRRSGKKRQDAGYPDDDQLEICDAFRTFVQVHQVLLSTVIGKHGLLSQAQFTQPVAAILRQLESGVDTLAFGIIDLVPTCAEGATADKNKLDDTLQSAEDKYST